MSISVATKCGINIGWCCGQARWDKHWRCNECGINIGVAVRRDGISISVARRCGIPFSFLPFQLFHVFVCPFCVETRALSVPAGIKARKRVRRGWNDYVPFVWSLRRRNLS